jgi:glycosyltransferase involved in cell wall biosynthesis
VTRDPWFRDADVVQLYNLHGSYFSFTALPRITRRRPVFWILQDQWAMTGHVTYSYECERWRTGCGECPYLREYPALRRDTTATLWRLKRAVYERSRLELVVPSRWLEGLTRESPLLRRFPVHRIPHGVDTELFRPGSREQARARLGLPAERPIVFFSAWDLRDRRKGLHLLLEALERLDPRPFLLLAGDGSPTTVSECQSLGPVADDHVLADAYRAADVYAVPTIADVLTKTAPEAIASGIPCVSFDRGGVTDVVRHMETGYQARFGDVADLARGIDLLLRDGDLPAKLGRQGRELAEREFSSRVQVDRYVDLYRSKL